MKLTTKRDWRYFWRELFLYMIPMILIVGTVDVFYHFVRCPLHPEWSAPCSINWILAALYWVFLLLTIIFALISARMLKKVKKQIENEFTESIDNKSKELKIQQKEKSEVEKVKSSKPKKIIVKTDKKSDKKLRQKKRPRKLWLKNNISLHFTLNQISFKLNFYIFFV